MTKNEAEMDEETVREEHLKAVNVRAHWIYLVSVLVGSFVLMTLLIALIGAGGG